MIKWIARVLRNEGDQLSDYSIEYVGTIDGSPHMAVGVEKLFMMI
jgi:hypothetical protein